MDGNPWVDRFPATWSDEELDRIIAAPAGTLPDLGALQLDVARAKLLEAFDQLVVPSLQMRSALRRLLNLARAGAQQLFPDRRSFLARAYAKDPDPCKLPMLCITGLAGCGKTALIKALMRSLPPASLVDVPGHSRFRLIPGYALTARACVGLGQILEPVFPERLPASRSIFGAARRQLARDGVALLVPDELQFVTQSTSGAQVTNLLLRLGCMGPPVAYVTNFSLVHRLNVRPQEQRDRLLSDPLILLPESFDSEDWIALLNAYFSVHPAFADLAALPDIGVEIHLRTYALKRNVPKLLALAYCSAREDGSLTVRLKHLQSAYLSLSYAAARNDVEILLRSRIAGFGNREDLWCPLTGPDMFAPAIKAESAPADPHAEELAKAALTATMTAEESKHLKAITKAVGLPSKPERQARPKVTAASLAAGARALTTKRDRGHGGAAA